MVRIGNVCIDNPVFLAPMAGVSDSPFRILVKELGCGLVYTEMISAKGLIYNSAATFELLAFSPEERPIAVQIFGAEPDSMARAAEIVEKRGADLIDINMGCPTPKITRNGEGAALMRNPALAEEIMRAVVSAVNAPVTVKIRKGWDHASINAVELACRAEAAGIKAVAVHGRTRDQYYAGKADWDIIRQVKQAVTIPVIGNGDIRSPWDAARMMAETGCDAVMIGRAAQGNPWIFAQVSHYLRTGEILPAPALSERLAMVRRHLEMLVAHKGEYTGVREMRRHAAWYTKGCPGAAQLRVLFNQAETPADFFTILQQLKIQG